MRWCYSEFQTPGLKAPLFMGNGGIAEVDAPIRVKDVAGFVRQRPQATAGQQAILLGSGIATSFRWSY
jgi:hypothetical protein